jgi:formate dehydrogenase iron-sulfur subunit
MCYTKVIEGQPTSCASVCPAGAIKFGVRDELAAEAHERINQNPDRYHNYVYGENEVGGTNTMYLVSSAVPLENFGFDMNVGTESYPDLTWAALSRVPGIALYVVIWVSLVYFITQRRIPGELQNPDSPTHE